MTFLSRYERFLLIYVVMCLCVLRYVRTLAIESKMLKNQSSNAIDSASKQIDSVSVNEDSRHDEPEDIFDELMDIFEGRRRRHHHHHLHHRHHHGGIRFSGGKRGKRGKRYSRIFFPFIIGFTISKFIIIPIILKFITVMSTAAFVFSKMSLIGTLMLGLKWFLTNSNAQTRQADTSSKIEIVHVPVKKNHDWDRETEHTHKYTQSANDVYEPYYSDHDVKPNTYS